MLANLAEFWKSVLRVFIVDGFNFGGINVNWYNGSTTYTSSMSFLFHINRASNLLAYLTLIGLCIFLFYQFYKIVHALIGGVYEDAL